MNHRNGLTEVVNTLLVHNASVSIEGAIQKCTL